MAMQCAQVEASIPMYPSSTTGLSRIPGYNNNRLYGGIDIEIL